MPDGLFRYTKAGKPAWGVRLKYKNAEDQWRAKTWRGFATELEALAFRDQARAARVVTVSPPVYNGAPTLRGYLQDWMDTYAAPTCKRSTALSYIRVINKYWLPLLGDIPLAHLTIAHVKGVLAEALAQGKSRQTIRNIIGPVREALNHAVGEGILPSNPILALKPHLRQLRDQRRHIHPLTPAQRAALLAAAASLHPTLHQAVMLAIYTGVRTGELLGLQWGDLDPQTKRATIRRARVWDHLETPKNHHLRVIDLPPVLLAALHRPAQAPPEAYILQQGGAPITYKWFARVFRDACALAHLPDTTPKTLRHTYASMMIAIHANPKYIQAQMGHSSIKVTFDIYGHLFTTERYADQLG